jgi:hypothetical protein
VIATVSATEFAAILPKQPIPSLSTAHLFAERLQAGTVIPELGSSALHFPAQIEQLRRSVFLAQNRIEPPWLHATYAVSPSLNIR